MAIVINSNPVDYSSLHGDLLFVVYEATKANDPTTYPNYKYVADIYIGGTLIERLKAFPRPDNKRGVFNIAKVVRSYLDSLQLQPSDQVNCQEFGDGEFYLDVQVKFGEEYSFTTYTNLTVDSSRRYYNFYPNRYYGGATILEDKLSKAATNRPLINYIERDTPYFFIPYKPDATDTDVTLELEVFSASNVSLATTSYLMNFTSGANLIQINLAPERLIDVAGLSFPSNAAYYTVGINSDVYRFDIKEECIHTPYTLHWLNQYGGFDSFTFYKLSRQSYEGEKKSFTQDPYRISSSGLVEYGASTPNGLVAYESKTTFATTYREKLKLNSDLLTDEEFEWLRELKHSPLVYMTEAIPAGGSNLIPVTIEEANYEVRKYVNDKLQSWSITVDYGQTLNSQFR